MVEDGHWSGVTGSIKSDNFFKLCDIMFQVRVVDFLFEKFYTSVLFHLSLGTCFLDYLMIKGIICHQVLIGNTSQPNLPVFYYCSFG